MNNIENTLERLRILAGELPENQQNILNVALLEFEAFQDEVSKSPNRLSYDISYLINKYHEVFEGKTYEMPVEDQDHLQELEALHKRVIEQESSCNQEYLDLLNKHKETSKRVKERLVKERDEFIAQMEANEKKMADLESAQS